MAYDQFIEASNLINQIEEEYNNAVHVERIDTTTVEGLARFNEYNLTATQTVVLNRKSRLEGEQLTLENLRNYIDAYLRGEDPGTGTFQPINAIFAFSTGLFSGLSPCLMAMLAFILSYTSGTATSSKSGILRVLVFALGFTSAIMLVGTFVAAILARTPSFYITMIWATSVLMIIVGLNLVGLLSPPSSLKSFFQKLATRARIELAQKYRATAVGLFSLGFMFYFVNLCTAPLSLTVLPALTAPGNVYLLPIFAAGVLIPFLAVSVVAGGSPALARKVGARHRLKIRAFSGLVLLAYSVWLIGFNLLSSEILPAYNLAANFSTSLLAMFAFILVYSASTSRRLKQSLAKSLVFALGLISGYTLLAISFIAGSYLYRDLFANLQTVTIVVAAIMISAGLVLMVLSRALSGSELLKKRQTIKHALPLLALYFLGFLYFFTTIRVFPLSMFITDGTGIDINMLLTFSLFMLAPFLAVGIVGGALPRLARDTHEKHRRKIQALSGLVLLSYAVWLLLRQ